MTYRHRSFWRTLKPATGSAPRGFALIAALLIMIPLLLLAVVMLRTTTIDERIAGNTLDKQRAFQTAQSGLEFAEWALRANTSTNTGVACSASTNKIYATTAESVVVCSNDQFATASPAKLSNWTYYMKYQVIGANYNGFAQQTSADTAATYVAPDQIHIYYLGTLNSNGTEQLYRVTSAGTGANDATNSIVQSVYAVSATANDLSGP